MEKSASHEAEGQAPKPDQPGESSPKRKVTFGLGIDIKASVDEHMRRNKGVMERLKDL